MLLLDYLERKWACDVSDYSNSYFSSLILQSLSETSFNEDSEKHLSINFVLISNIKTGSNINSFL